MNIQEAKEEIEKAVRAYTARTEAGNFRIPLHRQRPLLLIGPPGIGKTAVMEQIARECGIGLVAYTMTHHTRQSAVGLPVLEQRTYEGRSYTVTSYTMSEILASVYDQMEKSGCREGILFLDEINCVSETLMPAMLQFLQYKTFGGHRLPEGWVIAAAGNPPAYNRSVREFDTVTLDRVRKIEVEPSLQVWKDYAVRKGLHPAVLSFLELRPERFYVMSAGGAGFVTGRAWEDLSEILLTMEDLELQVEDQLFGQYLQEEETAVEFSVYYRLYEKWKQKLKPEQILEEGPKKQEAGREFSALAADERLCIVWLLLQRLLTMGRELKEQTMLADSLRYFAGGLEGAEQKELESVVQERLAGRKKALEIRKENGLLEPGEEERERTLSVRIRVLTGQAALSGDRKIFCEEGRKEEQKAQDTRRLLARSMEHAAAFVRGAFGERQELVILFSGLLEHPVCEEVMKKELPQLREEALGLLNAGAREEELRRRLLSPGRE